MHTIYLGCNLDTTLTNNQGASRDLEVIFKKTFRDISGTILLSTKNNTNILVKVNFHNCDKIDKLNQAKLNRIIDEFKSEYGFSQIEVYEETPDEKDFFAKQEAINEHLKGRGPSQYGFLQIDMDNNKEEFVFEHEPSERKSISIEYSSPTTSIDDMQVEDASLFKIHTMYLRYDIHPKIDNELAGWDLTKRFNDEFGEVSSVILPSKKQDTSFLVKLTLHKFDETNPNNQTKLNDLLDELKEEYGFSRIYVQEETPEEVKLFAKCEDSQTDNEEDDSDLDSDLNQGMRP